MNKLPHGYKFTCNAHTFSRIVPFFGCPPSQHTKCQQYSKYQFKPPNTRTIPTLCVSPLCYLGCFIIILFSGCSSITAHQVLTVLQVPIPATQHKDDTLVSLFVLFRVLHQAEALRSHTPTQRLEFILFTESANSRVSTLMCAERVLTTCLTSGRPENA